MVQESPRKRKSVLVIVTNYALYVLTLPRGLLCSVCESWRLCPTGPRFLRKVPHYKVDKLLLDYSTVYGAGHRFKLEVGGSETRLSTLLSPSPGGGTEWRCGVVGKRIRV